MRKFLLGALVLTAVSYVQAQNLLQNGGFDTDGVLGARETGTWGMWTDNGGAAEVINGVATVTPVETTLDENWEMQLEQWDFTLENDVTYVATFDAWADADRTICLTIEDPANSYQQLGLSDDEGAYLDANGDYRSKWDLDITTEQTTYTLTFTVDQMQDNSTPKFAFLLAQANDIVYIDNVSLEEQKVSVHSTKDQALRMYPNPASGKVAVQSNVGDLINIYNATGSLVMSTVSTQRTQIMDITNLNSGLYIVNVGDRSERLVVK